MKLRNLKGGIAHQLMPCYAAARSSARHAARVQRKLAKSWIEKISASGPGMMPKDRIQEGTIAGGSTKEPSL